MENFEMNQDWYWTRFLFMMRSTEQILDEPEQLAHACSLQYTAFLIAKKNKHTLAYFKTMFLLLAVWWNKKKNVLIPLTTLE